MSPKFVADTIMVVAMPVVLLFMVRLALKVPLRRPLEPLLADLGWLKYKTAVVASSAVVGAVIGVIGALTATRVIAWLKDNPEVLRYTYGGIMVVMAASITYFIATWRSRLAVSGGLLLGIALWLVWPHWLTASVLGLAICTAVVAVWKPRLAFVWLFLIVLALAGIYDAVQVYVTGDMQEVVFSAIDTALPLMVVVPGEPSLNATPESGLGLGDIVTSGVLLVAAARIAKRTGAPWILYGGIVGYIVADIAVIAVGKITQHFQPATIYFVPGIAFGVMLAAVLSGHGQELRRPHPDTVSQT